MNTMRERGMGVDLLAAMTWNKDDLAEPGKKYILVLTTLQLCKKYVRGPPLSPYISCRPT